MTKLAPILSALLLLPSLALAGDCGQLIDKSRIRSLKAPLTLGALNMKFGEWCQGHGPFSWYDAGNGNEIWFYWKMPDKPAQSDEEAMRYEVLVVTEMEAYHEEKQTVLWPPTLVGKDIKDIIRKEYETHR